MYPLYCNMAICSIKMGRYEQAASILKELLKFCNIYEQFDLWKETNRLLEWVSAANCQRQGKYRLKTIIKNLGNEGYEGSVAEYVSPKVQIKRHPVRGRCIIADKTVYKGELVMIAQALVTIPAKDSAKDNVHQEMNESTQILSE